MYTANYLPQGHVDRILVPVNFSSGSSFAIERAIEIARLFEATVWLLHVLDPVTTLGARRLFPDELADLRHRGESSLEALGASVRNADVKCALVFRDGNCEEQIRNVVLDSSIDLMVLTAKAGAHSALHFATSTAECLIQKTTIPVLTIRESARIDCWPTGGPTHILFATDLSQESLRAWHYARSLRERFHAQLTVVHVLDVNESLENTQFATNRLEVLVASGEGQAAILHGPVGRTLCDAALKMHIDLVVSGLKRHAFQSNVLFGHVHREIVLGAPCAVLTIPEWR